MVAIRTPFCLREYRPPPVPEKKFAAGPGAGVVHRTDVTSNVVCEAQAAITSAWRTGCPAAGKVNHDHGALAYPSIVCSTQEARIALISRAIDEVEARAHAATASGAMAEVTARLAGIWAMVAELDPALARRLPGYGPYEQ